MIENLAVADPIADEEAAERAFDSEEQRQWVLYEEHLRLKHERLFGSR